MVYDLMGIRTFSGGTQAPCMVTVTVEGQQASLPAHLQCSESDCIAPWSSGTGVSTGDLPGPFLAADVTCWSRVPLAAAASGEGLLAGPTSILASPFCTLPGMALQQTHLSQGRACIFGSTCV